MRTAAGASGPITPNRTAIMLEGEVGYDLVGGVPCE